ncbi:MAG: MFS transporter [Pseudomonadota bacterium]
MSPTNQTSNSAEHGKATRREWIGLLVLTLPCLLIAMDMTVLHLAVPHLTAALNPTSDQLLWIVDIYGFLIAGCLITMGTLGDRIGRRKLLMIGAAAFGVASALAAFAPTAEMLIVARAALGIAGATLMPSTLSLIRSMFHDENERTFAIAAWMTTFMVGTAAGPLLGGVVLNFFWWGAVFLINVPVMALLLLAGPLLLPEHRDDNPGRLDLFSAALSLASVLAIIYGVKVMAAYGFGGAALASIVLGALGAVVFLKRQRKLADPLLDLSLFANRAISVPIIVQTLAIFTGMAFFLFMAQHLQLVSGLTPIMAGVWMLPATVSGIIGSLSAPALVARIRPAFVIAGASMIAFVGFALLAVPGGSISLITLIVGATLFSLGISPVAMLCTDMVVTAAPPARAGSAAALSETSAELGGALGIAILGSIGTAIYRTAMMDAVPANVPADLAETIRSTLGGAAAATAQLPVPLGDDLLDLSRHAFIDGMQFVAAICAILMLAATIAALVTLRHFRRASDAKETDDVPAPETAIGAVCAPGRVD